MNSTLLTEINSDRASLGLRPRRLDSRLVGLAGSRSIEMAATDQLAHVTEIGAAERGVGVAPVPRRRGDRRDERDVGRDRGDVHLRALAQQPRALGPDHQQCLQLRRHRRGVPAGRRARPSPRSTSRKSRTSRRRSHHSRARVAPERRSASRGAAAIPSSRRTPPACAISTSSTAWTAASWRTHSLGVDLDDALGITFTNRPHGHTYSIEIRARDWRNNVSKWVTRSVRVP